VHPETIKIIPSAAATAANRIAMAGILSFNWPK
jgi:hypothetical protein